MGRNKMPWLQKYDEQAIECEDGKNNETNFIKKLLKKTLIYKFTVTGVFLQHKKV